MLLAAHSWGRPGPRCAGRKGRVGNEELGRDIGQVRVQVGTLEFFGYGQWVALADEIFGIQETPNLTGNEQPEGGLEFLLADSALISINPKCCSL